VEEEEEEEVVVVEVVKISSPRVKHSSSDSTKRLTIPGVLNRLRNTQNTKQLQCFLRAY